MSSFLKISTVTLLAGSLAFSACSKKSAQSDSGAVTIPDAPDAALQTILTEFANGNGGILWQAMPTSYQADVNTVVHLIGAKLDAEVYDQTFALVGRLGQVAEKQKAFILNTEMGQRSAEEIEKLDAAFPSIVGLLQTLANSELASIAGMQTFEGQAFFDTTVSKLMEYVVELSRLSDETSLSIEELRSVLVTPVEVTDGAAKLTLSVPGIVTEEEQFVKVENRWVPAALASEWGTGIADMKAQLEAISPETLSAQKPQLMGVLTMIDGVLTQIETAETQAQFDQAVQGAMMPLMGLMMMGQGFGGGSAAPATSPPAP